MSQQQIEYVSRIQFIQSSIGSGGGGDSLQVFFRRGASSAAGRKNKDLVILTIIIFGSALPQTVLLAVTCKAS